MEHSLIDLGTFDELRDAVGDEFAAELVDTFLEETPGILAQLRAALAGSDTNGYRRAAHSLKSNCNTFGALTLGRMARDAELDGFTGDPALDSVALDALDALYVAVAAELKQLVHG